LGTDGVTDGAHKRPDVSTVGTDGVSFCCTHGCPDGGANFGTWRHHTRAAHCSDVCVESNVSTDSNHPISFLCADDSVVILTLIGIWLVHLHHHRHCRRCPRRHRGCRGVRARVAEATAEQGQDSTPSRQGQQ